MALTIKVLSYKGSLPAQEISARFDEQGGSIGRSPDNHLVLPDPEKFISRLHANIVFQNGQYFIQDTSTGGTFLGPNDTLLQHNQAVLTNGQRVRIGEYELMVNFTGADAERAALEPVRQLELADSGLLEDPFASAEKPPAPDFFSSFIEQPESSAFHENFTPPKVAETSTASGVDELDFGDLLSKLESLPGAGGIQKADLPPLPDDFFTEEANAEPIPAQAETSSPFDAVISVSPVAPEPPKPQPFEDLFESPAPPIGTAAIADPFAASQAPVSEAAEEVQQAFEIPRPSAVSGKTGAPGAWVPGPHSAAQVAHPEPQPASAGDGELIREFLAGIGIADPQSLPVEQWPALMRTSGELMRSMVEGLMLVLRARAELKSQFRVSVTTMRSMNNNPLKFTPNVDDAIKLILAPTNPGFLPPKEAVREGFSDIMNHQMAMTAGIQAALADSLRSFDPERIEKAAGDGLMFQKKAKCWEQYVESYPQLKAAALEEFFGEAFVEAYEKQMLLLSRSSNPQ